MLTDGYETINDEGMQACYELYQLFYGLLYISFWILA